MNIDVALNPNMRELYPFSRLSEAANVLIMPALHSASIATSLLATAGDATVVGPILSGLAKPIQIAPLGATVSDIVTFATLAAFQAGEMADAARKT
jgi:malate dehydrogenase (oxaloacetate-decarboxylating)(NADP+)